MDLSTFTLKSQEALQAAQQLALRQGHTELAGEHLLVALLEQADGLAPRVLEKAGVDLVALRKAGEAELARLPRVSGGNAQVYLARRTAQLLEACLLYTSDGGGHHLDPARAPRALRGPPRRQDPGPLARRRGDAVAALHLG